jgi:hypothetical protein
MTIFTVMSLTACGVSRMSTGPITPLDRSAISSIDIDAIRGRVDNGYDVVRLLRPFMLVVRDRSRLQVPTVLGPNDSPGVRVYLDDVSVGGIEMLRNVPKDAIVRVQWLSAIDATTRYGGGHLAGVIAVTTGAHR